MKRIAVLIPCYNEEKTIEKVVSDFRSALPDADIYVYDNNSADRSNELARNAGAIVKKEYKQGKGCVVRSMFNDIDADVYVMVDGDDTYPAEEVDKLLKPVFDGEADMVVGDRLSSTYLKENKRPFHNFGNILVRKLVNLMFHQDLKDIMTGYRAFSRDFVKSIPVMSDGFQIETEMTVFAIENKFNIKECSIEYRDRTAGSTSKLHTFRDGFKVLITLFDLFKNYRPLMMFGILATVFAVISLIIGIPVIVEYGRYHFVYKVPSAILASALAINAFLLFCIGLILDAIKNQTKVLLQSIKTKNRSDKT